MAMQLGALRAALLEAGASAGKADKAAEEGAAHAKRLAGTEAKISALTWMAGVNVGLMVLALGGSAMLYCKLCGISGQLAQLLRLMH